MAKRKQAPKRQASKKQNNTSNKPNQRKQANKRQPKKKEENIPKIVVDIKKFKYKLKEGSKVKLNSSNIILDHNSRLSEKMVDIIIRKGYAHLLESGKA